jgi:hypothetical protein
VGGWGLLVGVVRDFFVLLTIGGGLFSKIYISLLPDKIPEITHDKQWTAIQKSYPADVLPESEH